MRNIHLPQRIISLAREEAEKSNVKRAKVSALVLDKQLRHVFAKAHNLICMSDSRRFTIHAEEAVVLKTRKELKDYVLLVYRRKKVGDGTSKPCKKCRKLIEIAGVKKVIYLNEFGDYVMEHI